MAHPRRYDDGDPLLARLREVALAFPESVEVEAWGRPTFRAGKKIFAVLGEHGVIFKPEAGERDALVHGQRFSIPPYFGPNGWLALVLDDRTDWDEVRELLEGSYRQVALTRMINALVDEL